MTHLGSNTFSESQPAMSYKMAFFRWPLTLRNRKRGKGKGCRKPKEQNHITVKSILDKQIHIRFWLTTLHGYSSMEYGIERKSTYYIFFLQKLGCYRGYEEMFTQLFIGWPYIFYMYLHNIVIYYSHWLYTTSHFEVEITYLSQHHLLNMAWAWKSIKCHHY